MDCCPMYVLFGFALFCQCYVYPLQLYLIWMNNSLQQMQLIFSYTLREVYVMKV